MGRTSSVTMPSMVGDRGSRVGCRRKSVMFFCLSRFGITKFVITETLWNSVIFKTIKVSFHRGRFIVVHLYSSFLLTPWFSLRDKFISKKYHFWGLWAHIFEAITVKISVMVRIWHFLPRPNFITLWHPPHAKFCKKKSLKRGKFVPKIRNFCDF